MLNKDIRQLAKENNVYLWQVAHELGITDATFSRRLRFELSEKDKQEIRAIIERLSTSHVGQEV